MGCGGSPGNPAILMPRWGRISERCIGCEDCAPRLPTVAEMAGSCPDIERWPHDEIARLRAEVERLTRERDKARQKYCGVEASWRRANHEAKSCPVDVAREEWPDDADRLFPEEANRG